MSPSLLHARNDILSLGTLPVKHCPPQALSQGIWAYLETLSAEAEPATWRHGSGKILLSRSSKSRGEDKMPSDTTGRG